MAIINLEDNLEEINSKPSIELVVGMDLSFNSTGLTFTTCKNGNGLSVEFHRIVYNETPRPIKNINQHTYKLPVNIAMDDIVDETDFYSEDQAFITLKAMMCCKRITTLLVTKINKLKVKFPEHNISLYINIEGFIMPNLAGNQQLRVLGGLIMLQGLIRSDLIKYNIAEKFHNFRIFITSPTQLKLYFTGNGSSTTDKALMLEAFLEVFDGVKLLPDTTSLAKVNDVIDSFALMINCYHRVFHSNDFYMQREMEKANKKAEKALKKKAAKKKIPAFTIELLDLD